jgi:hypothetical protein
VIAAGYCELESGGVARHLVEPRIVTDPGRRMVPSAIRPILKVAGVSEFMVLSVA